MTQRILIEARVMPGVRAWLSARLGNDPMFKDDPREAYWLPDGRLLSQEQCSDLSDFERDYLLPMRAVTLEYD